MSNLRMLCSLQSTCDSDLTGVWKYGKQMHNNNTNKRKVKSCATNFELPQDGLVTQNRVLLGGCLQFY